MRLSSVEGNRQRLDGGAMFGNVPRALWSQWLTPDSENRLEFACRALLVEDLLDRPVLFEAGIGAFFNPKMRARYAVLESEHVLLRSLEARGVTHEDVAVVVLSHLHFDHAGGLLKPFDERSPPELLFPNARFVVSERAWERACQPHPRDRASFIPELPELLRRTGRLELISGSVAESLGHRVRFEFSDGHTPGLALAEIGGDGGVAFCSDLIPARPWVHLPVTMGYDRNAERLIEEKRRFLLDKVARGVHLFFTHDLGCAAALPVIDGERFAVTAEVASLDGVLLR